MDKNSTIRICEHKQAALPEEQNIQKLVMQV